jgi:hypothetical protein
MDEATISILASFGISREEAVNISGLTISSTREIDQIWDGFAPNIADIAGRMTHNIDITYLDGTTRSIEYRDPHNIYEEGYQHGFETRKIVAR